MPHLTVAHGDEEVLGSAEAELASALPLVVNIRFASLIVEDDAERWQERTRFALHP